MDAKEAIEVLRHMRMSAQDSVRTITNDRYLKEELVAEVEADTIAISALEKQIPKEPIFDSGNRLCGECSEIIKAYESHCPFCGQAIKKE